MMRTLSFACMISTFLISASCSDHDSSNSRHDDGPEPSAFSRPLSESRIDEYKLRARNGDVDAASALYSHYSYLELQNRREARAWLEVSADLGSLSSTQLFILENAAEGKCVLAEDKLHANRAVVDRLSKGSVLEIENSIKKCHAELEYRLKNGRSPSAD